MTLDVSKGVWLFQARSRCFVSGAFVDVAQAEAWIQKHGLSGLLVRYDFAPDGVGAEIQGLAVEELDSYVAASGRSMEELGILDFRDGELIS